MKMIPMPRMRGHRIPIPTTMRHEADPVASRAPIEMQSSDQVSHLDKLVILVLGRLTSDEDTKRDE